MSRTISYKTDDAKQGHLFVGKSVAYKFAKEKVTGAAKYTIDVQRPAAYVAKALSCPHAHARIKSIDVSEAEKLPGVAAVITAADVPGEKFNPAGLEYAARFPELAEHDSVKDMRALPGKSHYKGEIIAAVAAKTEEIALAAFALIKVDYEVLPYVLTIDDAMKEGAPLVHEEAGSNISMVFDHFPGNRGDADATFAAAAVTVEGSLQASRQHTMSIEPLSCVTEFDTDGNLTIWIPHQRPFILRRQIAALFGIREGKINVVCDHAGGFFGEGNYAILPFMVCLAKKANRPVRLELSREEMVLHVPCREMFRIGGKIGFSPEGMIMAATEDAFYDSGAYFNRSANLLPPAMGAFSGQYRLPVYRGTAKIVYTNTPGTSGIRGYGTPCGMTLLSHLMDLGAEKLGMDRVEFRIQNYRFRGGQKPDYENAAKGSGEPAPPSVIGLGSETQESVIRVAAGIFGWAEKSGRPKADGRFRRGIGIGDYMDVSGPQPLEVNDRQCVMTLEEDASVTVTLNFPDGGQNTLGAAAQIAAETSGLQYEDFRILHEKTDGALYDIGMGGNSGNYGMGHLFAHAGRMLKKAILEKAAGMMGLPEEELEIRDGLVFAKADGATLSIKKLAYDSIVVQKGASEHISITARYSAKESPLAVGVVMADVRVDVETGDIHIDKLQLCHDCGVAINPVGVEGQLQGGGVMGVGYALFEDLAIGEDGGVRGNNFNTYKLPSALDIPDLDVVVYEDPCPVGPFGAKGIGQSGTIGVPGAIYGAIYDATGIWLDTMPYTPEKLLAAIKEQGLR